MSKTFAINLYAVRDKKTGKFVGDITNPRRKFWELKKFCESAIATYIKRNFRYGLKYDLEMVELVCVESKEYERLKEIEWMYNDLNK